jgi:lysophospholipid acyltransferase (LPLAT)-like uncharacterized protein
MKLRIRWLMKAAALILTKVARFWIDTLPVRLGRLGPIDTNPYHTEPGDHYVYAFWHEYIAMMPFLFTRRDICGLVSEHADAQIYADVLRFLRMPSIRGSTNRHGVKAVREILRKTGKLAHLAIATDGPRGPRRQVKPGLAYLASRTGKPVVPIGIGFDRPWRLRSWDRFAVPRPWSFATIMFGVPIVVPPGAGKDELEFHRKTIEASLQSITNLAEQWAETGRYPAVQEPAAEPSSLTGEQRKAG